MAYRTFQSWCAAALLAASGVAAAQAPAGAPPTPEQIRAAIRTELPAPPDGFSWQLYKNTVFLKPAGWHEQEAPRPPGLPAGTYATSPEAFSQTKPFEMGFTVNVFSGLQRLRGLEARKAVPLLLKPILDTHSKQDILMLDQQPAGDFERTVMRYRDAPPGLKPIIVHKFILANNVTDSMHDFTFESPEASWAENWARYGAPMLSRLQVIPQLPAH